MRNLTGPGSTLGTVRASVKAGGIDVLGSLQGNVEEADKIYIRNGATFVGDIHARGIVIEDGGFVRGKVSAQSEKFRFCAK